MRILILSLMSGGLLSLTSCSDVRNASSPTEPVESVAVPVEEVGVESSRVVSDDHAASPQTGHGHGGTAEVEDHKATNRQHGQHAVGNDDAKHAKAHRQRGSHSHHHGHGGKNAAVSKIAIGEKVPDFEVTLNGKVWKLSELQKDTAITPDGTLVLTFWCSFCHSCRDVELDLDKLANEFQGKAGVIALDASSGETPEKISAFAKKRGLTLPIALSADGSAADVFGVKSTTTTVVIDREGRLRYFGQFAAHGHAYAKDALNAVLAGKDVPVERTRPKG